MTSVYILKLSGDHYYVGRTEDAIQRYQEHVDGKGSVWTRKYIPISLHEVIADCDQFDEDKYVKKYMHKYGIDKVRGGSYSTIDLTPSQIEFLQKEIWGASDKCFKCGAGGHWAQKCKTSSQTRARGRGRGKSTRGRSARSRGRGRSLARNSKPAPPKRSSTEEEWTDDELSI